MGNSLMQYRIVTGMHSIYLKAREYSECFKGKFWTSLVLLFYMQAIYLPVLKTLIHQFELTRLNRLWLTQIYLYRFYIPELIRLANDVETNPGLNVNLEENFSAPCAFISCNEGSQSRMCSVMNLPLVVKHNFKPSKKVGQPSKLLHILGDGNCLFRAFSYVITGRQTYHMKLREQIINHMRDIETLLLPHMNTSLKGYLAKTKMPGNGVWGTDVQILTAASLLSGADIFVYSSAKEILHGDVNIMVNIAGRITFDGAAETLNVKGKTLNKQEAIFTDNTSSVRVVLWENDMKRVESKQC